jgi:hypothetical protein
MNSFKKSKLLKKNQSPLKGQSPEFETKAELKVIDTFVKKDERRKIKFVEEASVPELVDLVS